MRERNGDKIQIWRHERLVHFLRTFGRGIGGLLGVFAYLVSDIGYIRLAWRFCSLSGMQLPYRLCPRKYGGAGCARPMQQLRPADRMPNEAPMTVAMRN
jgi:hypothetical protein